MWGSCQQLLLSRAGGFRVSLELEWLPMLPRLTAGWSAQAQRRPDQEHAFLGVWTGVDVIGRLRAADVLAVIMHTGHGQHRHHRWVLAGCHVLAQTHAQHPQKCLLAGLGLAELVSVTASRWADKLLPVRGTADGTSIATQGPTCSTAAFRRAMSSAVR